MRCIVSLLGAGQAAANKQRRNNKRHGSIALRLTVSLRPTVTSLRHPVIMRAAVSHDVFRACPLAMKRNDWKLRGNHSEMQRSWLGHFEKRPIVAANKWVCLVAMSLADMPAHWSLRGGQVFPVCQPIPKSGASPSQLSMADAHEIRSYATDVYLCLGDSLGKHYRSGLVTGGVATAKGTNGIAEWIPSRGSK